MSHFWTESEEGILKIIAGCRQASNKADSRGYKRKTPSGKNSGMVDLRRNGVACGMVWTCFAFQGFMC